jgi:hypothetical protein
MNYSINGWYGRLGNNIQQISNAIYYCEKNKINFYCPPHEMIKSFQINFGEEKNISNRFFFYDDFSCDINELNKNRRRICLQYIVPNFNFFIKEPFDEETLVIHVRSGDVFIENPPNTYVQNPLSFYEKIIEKYEYVIIVTENDKKNPLLEKIKNNKKVTIQSTTIQNDFSTLLRAKNLATSGVGTFSIASALCSKNLLNLHCTSIFLDEHLNPKMLLTDNRIKVSIEEIKNYIEIGDWKNTKEQIEKMKNYVFP